MTECHDDIVYVTNGIDVAQGAVDREPPPQFRNPLFSLIVATMAAQLVEILKQASELNPRSPKR